MGIIVVSLPCTSYLCGSLIVFRRRTQSCQTQKAQELKKINPYVAVLTILSAVRGLEIWQRHKNNLPAEELEKQMIQHLLTGIIK